MSDKTRKDTTAAEAFGLPDLMNGPFGEAMNQYGETCAKNFSALQKEIAGFAEDRLASNQALAEKMSKCRDWNDLVQLQQDWARETSEAYLKESTRVAQLFTELSRAWLGPMGTLLEAAPTAAKPGSQGGGGKRS